MNHSEIINPLVAFNNNHGDLIGEPVQQTARRLKDLAGVFKNEEARTKLDQEQLVYEVQAFFPVPEGKQGGLFFGNSTIYPGRVGQEYYMTKGHFHAMIDRAEYYWCIEGEGVLILMDQNRKTWGEKMNPGSLHYIPGKIAHRVANTGTSRLRFGACWPADAGHDYESIAREGFGARLLAINETPTLVKS
ncbi:MAG: glucose-6-phosphate isomerase family protein [Candidatus Cyclobacteriaceae bacterium M3_2C_046]